MQSTLKYNFHNDHGKYIHFSFFFAFKVHKWFFLKHSSVKTFETHDCVIQGFEFFTEESVCDGIPKVIDRSRLSIWLITTSGKFYHFPKWGKYNIYDPSNSAQDHYSYCDSCDPFVWTLVLMWKLFFGIFPMSFVGCCCGA